MQVEQLQGQLVTEQDARKEERWFWLLAVTILVDVIATPLVGAGMLLIAFFEIVMLVMLAQRWGVDGVIQAMKAAAELANSLRDGSKKDD